MKIAWLVSLAFALTACGGQGSVMSRHRASLPADYANLVNPVNAAAPSLAQGTAVYVENFLVELDAAQQLRVTPFARPLQV